MSDLGFGAPNPAADTLSAPKDGPPSWNEELFQATCQLLVEPRASTSPWAGLGCLLVSLGLFALSFIGSLGPRELALVIPVLLLHEAGHWLGMHLFGYRNVRLFFIPFFGAAVSGTKHAAPAWQQAIVLLLGPLPGIALGLVLYLALAPAPEHGLTSLALCLIGLNGINLAPLIPLDGGRLLDVLLFSRRPWLAVAFRLLAVAGLVATAYLIGGSAWLLGLLALGVLLGTPSRYRRARHQRLFADNPQQLPDDLEQLDDSQKRELFGWARLFDHGEGDPTNLAGEMRTLHENMVSRQPRLLVWLLFLALYLGGIAASVGGGAFILERIEAHQAGALVSLYDEKMAEVRQLRRESKSTLDPKKGAALEGQILARRTEVLLAWTASPIAAQVRGLQALQGRPNPRPRERREVDWLRQSLLEVNHRKHKSKP